MSDEDIRASHHVSLEVGFRSWLQLMFELELTGFGIDPQDPPQGLADYWMMNGLALHSEVTEMMDEVGWKPWDASRGEWSNRDQVISEWADLMHFLAHMLLSVRATPHECAQALLAKIEKNYARQAQPGGDNVQARRCPHCKRSLDDAGTFDIGTVVYCRACEGIIDGF